MKFSNKQELQQTEFNLSSDIDFKDFMNLYKKYTAKPFLFFVINTTLASDNPLRFRKNLSRKNIEITMTINDKIRDEKLQYDINKEAAKISALSSGKIDKYEYLIDEEVLLSDQSRIILRVKFTYSLEKALEK